MRNAPIAAADVEARRQDAAAGHRAGGPDELIRFQNVEKTYDGETLVVKNLNLDIRRGEFLTVLGPSGSGKTTCLSMLAGFETITRGDIVLDGVSIKDVPPYRRNIGIVFQNYALFPHMTVAENLAFPLRVRKVPSLLVAERVKAALELVRLPGLGHRRPAQLSGGQQQRVAVARALVFEPKLLLMDEPLGALDKQLREQMQQEIKQLHEEVKITVVYVTHDQTEAMAMSDRIAVFHNGSVQQLGSPEDLYERPSNAFVADFVGESNRLFGTVVDIAGPTCRVELTEGGQVVATPVNLRDNGAATVMSVRPERVQVGAILPECENVVTAQVENVIYLGDCRKIGVRFSDAVRLIVKVPNTRSLEPMQPGQVLQIGWRAEDCRAFSTAGI